MRKIGKSVLDKMPRYQSDNLYKPYYSPEFLDIVKYIQEKFGKKVYIVGVRAFFEHGIPVHRQTTDFDIYTPITIEERDDLGRYARRRYPKTREVWRDFGEGLRFPSGEQVDINRTTKLYDDEWDKKSFKLDDTQIFIPPLEDIMILKLIAGRPRDSRDIGHVLRTGFDRLDAKRLMEKAKVVNVEKKLIKTIRRFGYKLTDSGVAKA